MLASGRKHFHKLQQLPVTENAQNPKPQTQDTESAGSLADTEEYQNDSFGQIVSIIGGQVEVLIEGTPEQVRPLVFVGNKPAWQDPKPKAGSDPDAKVYHYHFYVSGIQTGDEISLWAILPNAIELCESRSATEYSFERSIPTQLARAAAIARQPDSVAVTCWDGGHNPIGRAKVLYDCLEGRRPVSLFCFLFQEFGGDIWPPLAAGGANIVTIPWAERHCYLSAAAAMGIAFDTIWMCKSRAPTFLMASNIAHKDTKVILDFDDNEEQFSRSLASKNKAYGLPSIGLSRAVSEGIVARTAASASLVKDFKAVMVRHARKQAFDTRPFPIESEISGAKAFRIGFIGTVRPHKGLLEAARAISSYNQTNDTSVELHVYGDIKPPALYEELQSEGVVLKQNVPIEQLKSHLKAMDIILSGFPSGVETDVEITKYQISSKIGDALAVGKPVLVPNGPSVVDLKKTEGVILFDQATFDEAISLAMHQTSGGDLTFPEEFGFERAYRGFRKAEKIAEKGPRAGHALSLVPSFSNAPDPKPTLLLIWKQHDGGLYGRRMDMLGRSYRKRYPNHRVVVLEILFPDSDQHYRFDQGELGEKVFIRSLNVQKQKAGVVTEDGIEYRQLSLPKSDFLKKDMEQFLTTNRILPTNSVIVLYPRILHIEQMHEILHPYRIITDVVDNQLSWASKTNRLKTIEQYFALARMSDHVVFNSYSNYEFFKSKGFLSGRRNHASVIPNWYLMPQSFKSSSVTPNPETFDLIYSGNMNDRIDWDLMEKTAQLDPSVRLHLIGEASRAHEQLNEMLMANTNVIFHGAMNERMTLNLLSQTDLALMPHVVDDVSTYMNPLKVHMYAAIGLNAVSTNIPGIQPSDYLKVCVSHKEFLEAVAAARLKKTKTKPKRYQDEAEEYLNLISSLLGT